MTPSYQVGITRRANRDLTGIHGQAGGSLPATASGIIRDILAAFDSLRRVPNRTVVDPQPPDRRPPVRSLPVPPYVTLFRVYDDHKLVLGSRVRHGARRPLRRFD